MFIVMEYCTFILFTTAFQVCRDFQRPGKSEGFSKLWQLLKTSKLSRHFKTLKILKNAFSLTFHALGPFGCDQYPVVSIN